MNSDLDKLMGRAVGAAFTRPGPEPGQVWVHSEDEDAVAIREILNQRGEYPPRVRVEEVSKPDWNKPQKVSYTVPPDLTVREMKVGLFSTMYELYRPTAWEHMDGEP